MIPVEVGMVVQSPKSVKKKRRNMGKEGSRDKISVPAEIAVSIWQSRYTHEDMYEVVNISVLPRSLGPPSRPGTDHGAKFAETP